MIINLIITLLTIKNCPCSNAIDAESKPKFCSSSSAIVAIVAIVASPHERDILDRDEKDLNISVMWAIGTKNNSQTNIWDEGELSIPVEC